MKNLFFYLYLSQVLKGRPMRDVAYLTQINERDSMHVNDRWTSTQCIASGERWTDKTRPHKYDATHTKHYGFVASLWLLDTKQ